MQKIDLKGKRFERLLVLEEVKEKKIRKTLWKCLCDCGNIIVVTSQSIRTGNTKSCGCLHNDLLVKMSSKHGMTCAGKRSPEYVSWSGMKDRCYRKSNPAYKNYGGRGIRVCDRWLNSFKNFISDMGKKPSPIHSLDRFPDTNGNYEPSNWRWATPTEQAINKRNNKIIEYNGVKKTASQWSTEMTISQQNLNAKLKTKNFSEIYEQYKK